MIYLFHFKQRGLRGSVGLNDTVEDKVAVVGYVAEVAALRPFDRAVVFNLFDALIRKVPDKPACESVVSQKFFPVIVEVSETVVHRVCVFAKYERLVAVILGLKDLA